MKIVLVLTAALLLNWSSPVDAQVQPGPYPGPQPGPGYPSPGYPYPPPGAGQWPSCDQLAQAEQETFARLQFTPPSPERAQLEQQMGQIQQLRQSCWPR